MNPSVISAIAASVSTMVVLLTILFTVRQLRLVAAARHGEVVRWLFSVWGTQDAREAHQLVREVNALPFVEAKARYDNFDNRERYLFTSVYQLIELCGMLYQAGAIHEDEVFGYFGLIVAKWRGNMGRIVHGRYRNERPYPMGLIYADNLLRNYEQWGRKTHPKILLRLGGDPCLLEPVPSDARPGGSAHQGARRAEDGTPHVTGS